MPSGTAAGCWSTEDDGAEIAYTDGASVHAFVSTGCDTNAGALLACLSRFASYDQERGGVLDKVELCLASTAREVHGLQSWH